MSSRGRKPDNDEAERNQVQDQGAGGAATEAAEVTMRGDLDKIELADIFQTLGLSKMQGLLHLQNAYDKREIYFEDGMVRCLMPPRIESMRLGQRLVRAGVLSVESLKQALMEQKRSRQPLGEILVGRGLVREEHIEDLVSNQLQEDLFSLFTWRNGSFEFYRGEITDPVLVERLEAVPEFEVNGVLLEVARRSDEWDRNFDTLGSLDDVLVMVDENDLEAEDVDPDDARILSAASVHRTIRDLADATLLELFDCCTRIRELHANGRLAFADPADVIESCEKTISDGEARRAAAILMALLNRRPPLPTEQEIEVAGLLIKAGNGRRASEILIEASKRARNAEEGLQFARDARAADQRSLQALEHLVDELRTNGLVAELRTTQIELADTLFEGSQYERCLETLDQYESEDPNYTVTRPRVARALQKLNKPDEAIESLLEFAETLNEERDKAKLVAIYDQILRIDYRRKDVARLKKKLEQSRLAGKVRMIAMSATGAVLVAAGAVMFLDGPTSTVDNALIQEIVQLATPERVDEAAGMLRVAERELGKDHPSLEAARSAIARARQGRQKKIAAAQREEAGKLLDKATQAFDRGEIDRSLDLWFQQTTLGVKQTEVERQINRRLIEFTDGVAAVIEDLREKMPQAPSATQSQAEKVQTLELLRKDFRPREASIVRRLLDLAAQGRDDNLSRRQQEADPEKKVETQPLSSGEILLLALGQESPARIANWALQDEFFDAIDRLILDYESKTESIRLTEQLTPIYQAAKEHEKAFRFAEAQAAYDELARRHPENDALKVQFRTSAAKYKRILGRINEIEDATSQGRHAVAKARLQDLSVAHPEIPFERFVELPLIVRSTPEGAEVFVDERSVGTTPTVVRYRPGEGVRISLRLERYETVPIEIERVEDAEVHRTLARAADWTYTTKGTIDREMLIAGEMLVFSDRAANVTALRLRDGQPAWSRDFGDVSGLLSAPTPTDDGRIVVASFDGDLRCLSMRDGRTIWETPDLPAESRPLVDGPHVILGTADAEIVGVDRADGHVAWRTSLDGPVTADLIQVDGRVIVVTQTGMAYGIRPRDGHVFWRATVGTGVVATPRLVRGQIVIAADDGSVLLLDSRDGGVLWRSLDHGNLILRGDSSRDFLFVPDDLSLKAISLTDGRVRRMRSDQSGFRGPVEVARGAVFAPLGDGRIEVLKAEDFSPLYELRGERTALAPVAVTKDGTVLAPFGDRQLRAYRRLLR